MVTGRFPGWELIRFIKGQDDRRSETRKEITKNIVDIRYEAI